MSGRSIATLSTAHLPTAKDADPEAALLMGSDAEPGKQAQEAGSAEPPAGGPEGQTMSAFEPLAMETGVSDVHGEGGGGHGGGKKEQDVEGKGGVRKATRVGLIHFAEVRSKITTSEEEALKYARIVDLLCSVLLFMGYVIVSCWIFLAK